jgi:hypothetical protein
MRWSALWLAALLVLACTQPPPPESSTPAAIAPATRTAIAAAITQAPPAVHTAVAAILEAPQSIGTSDYVDPHALATDTPRYVGKALRVQGEAGLVRERNRVVYFSLLALPRASRVPQQVNVQSFGETSATVRQGQCYQVDGVGGGVDESVPFVIAMKIVALEAPSTQGCAAP